MRRASRAADAAYSLKAAADVRAGRGFRARLRPEAAGGLRALRSKLLEESKEELRLLREQRRREREEREEEEANAARGGRSRERGVRQSVRTCVYFYGAEEEKEARW